MDDNKPQDNKDPVVTPPTDDAAAGDIPQPVVPSAPAEEVKPEGEETPAPAPVDPAVTPEVKPEEEKEKEETGSGEVPPAPPVT